MKGEKPGDMRRLDIIGRIGRYLRRRETKYHPVPSVPDRRPPHSAADAFVATARVCHPPVKVYVAVFLGKASVFLG